MYQSTVHNLHMAAYKILKSEINKISDIMSFRDESIKLMVNILQCIIFQTKEKKPGNYNFNGFNASAAASNFKQNESDEYYPSTTFKFTLAKFLDIFAVMDALKNMKSSMSNDFSLFKRYFKIILPSASINNLNS